MGILIHNGSLHSPYFIFVRCAGVHSDRYWLDQFGLTEWQPVPRPEEIEYPRSVLITDDGTWTHIMDDWWYHLWHLPCTTQAIEHLAADAEVFACSVGEDDQSYNFAYYRNGSLVRKYVVTDPDYRGGVVTVDFGAPLPGEAAARKHSNELEIVLSIAASLGINVRHDPATIRIYAKAPFQPDGAPIREHPPLSLLSPAFWRKPWEYFAEGTLLRRIAYELMRKR